MIKSFNSRTTIQTLLIGLLFFALLFSNYKPLVITAYLTIVFTFLDVFHFISRKEKEKDLRLTIKKSTNSENVWPQTVTFLIFQILSILAVFCLSWYVMTKKLNIY